MNIINVLTMVIVEKLKSKMTVNKTMYKKHYYPIRLH